VLVMRSVAFLLCALSPAVTLAAQDGGGPRSVEGRVRRPGKPGAQPTPVPRQWVVLHRVGRDRAGPMDSTRTDANGIYRFQYRATGDADAVYFVTSSYEGIAYISPPLHAAVVRGDDADVMVFDTTSVGVHLRMEGRHIVLGAPEGDGGRQVTEVFDLSNDSARTLVARDARTPLWAATLPRGATAPVVRDGDIAPAAVTFTEGTVNLFAPQSPGIRQLALSYRLPAKAFPLTVSMDGPVTVLEVLTEEPRAHVAMTGLQQTASVTTDGRSFARHIAEDVPPGAVLRVDPPEALLDSGAAMVALIAAVMGLVMVVALAVSLRRHGRSEAATAVAVRHELDARLHDLALLDAAYERSGDSGSEAAQAHAMARAAATRRVANALAAGHHVP
jgi:hypothetical protein